MLTLLGKAGIVDDPGRSICGNTISRTLASTFSSDHFPSPIKCSND
jgi:hypothetical protein